MNTTPTAILKRLYDTLPHFPDGRIDYTHAHEAAVVSCVAVYNDEILLLKRSDKVTSYKNKWNTIGGYFDELVPLQEKIKEELREELGITNQYQYDYKEGIPFVNLDKEINMKWYVHPVLISFKEKPIVKLDWEHTDYAWVKQENLSQYDLVLGTEKNINILFNH